MAELEPLAGIIARERERMQLHGQKHKQEYRQKTYAWLIASLLASGDTDIESVPGDIEEFIFLLDYDGGQRWAQIGQALMAHGGH